MTRALETSPGPAPPGQGEPRGPDGEALSRRRLRRSIGVTLLSGMSVSVLLVSAIYTDTASIPTNTFTIGTLDISSSPTTAVITSSGLSPGSSTTAALVVTNAGTLALRYSIRSTTDENVLAAELDLTIKTGVSACTNGGFSSTGTVIYGPGDFGNTTGLVLVGNTTPGQQSDERTLPGGSNASETLCLQVTLPSSATVAVQGITSTATIALIAEQTANNP
jgi:hypothetical protein